jgi:antitoxin component YwqK of YwqJK toxin-antitoxin module
MKKLSILLAALFSLNFLSAQQMNDKGLYVGSEGELFNGVMVSNAGNVKSEITIKNGVASGDASYFFASGKLMETGVFKEGKKDKKWTRYNENGTISAIGFYTLGKKTGTWLVYDDNGKKRFEMNYADGEKSGVWTNWDENGVVVNTKDYSKAN